MLKEPRMTFEKTEIMAKIIINREIRTMQLTYDTITSVTLEPFEDRTLFKKFPSRRIVMRIKGINDPVIFREAKDGPFFEGYVSGLRRFCKDHRITFYDKTPVAEKLTN